MKLSELQDELSFALQADLENGVAWLNDRASAEFAKSYPSLVEAIGKILDLETIDPEQ